MSINLFRVVMLVAGAAIGYVIGLNLEQVGLSAKFPFYGALGGVAIAFLVISAEKSLKRKPLKVIMGGILGLLVGVITASLLAYSFLQIPAENPVFSLLIRAFINAIFGYLGVALGVRKAAELNIEDIRNIFARSQEHEDYKILDTSVIIDGRIADVVETGFLEGTLVVPQFILKELQHIADSSESVKRNRGRRGLEVLHRVQKSLDVKTIISEQDFPKIREVDAKLVALAKTLGGKIITNDFNLNKVAELQGIQVLNVNQLANAVKPVVLPGEMLSVYLLKEGKEYGQGIAYLDDGTMVVVDNARNKIGNTVEVSVTSVLQTTTGRMIFTRLKEDVEKEAHV